MKTVEKVKIKSGKLKNKQYKMVLTASGYVPRDPEYPLSGEGKHGVATCEKVAKVKIEEVQEMAKKEVKK